MSANNEFQLGFPVEENADFPTITNNNNAGQNNEDSDENKMKRRVVSAFETVDLDFEDEDGETHHREAHEIFLRLKNRRTKRLRAEKAGAEDGGGGGGGVGKDVLLKAVGGLFQIILDWVVDLVVAGSHFLAGRYWVGTLTLVFVFLGGAAVNFNLNVLMRRKNDKKFKDELRRLSPVFPYIMHIPSFLPFFSTGLNVHTARKLRSERDPKEIKRLENMLKVCDEHIVTDLLYESSYEGFPQVILQTIMLLEKPSFGHWTEFLPMLGVINGWYGISMAPIKLAKSLNNLQVTFPEVLAGLANKGVTLLSFSMFITAARQHFGDPLVYWEWEVPVATVLAILALVFVSDMPAIISFQVEMRLKRKMDRTRGEEAGEEMKRRRFKSDWQYVVNLISLLIPLTAIAFWTVVLEEKGMLGSARFIALSTLFALGFCVAFLGYCCNPSLAWLGQFSTDILLLLFIGVQSRCTGIAFNELPV